ncbi:GGDEF domain-containing protein [Alicyclobacillus sp. ALC3]|uniref:GGDEF domain-containing protein n=1 Tax=Alicyclobacillus sp. ALC3 TaxID=2796143 RepID=UPI0023780238|nr:GGDEF domain-containing protein [Alicyclobacillus sp. ALC3]WDL96455.1 GGDEF domain-containing protein [Alicyclobacillus sp. ALC3]
MARLYSRLRQDPLEIYFLSYVALFLVCVVRTASPIQFKQWTDIILFAVLISVFESNLVDVSNDRVSLTMTSALLFAESTNIGLFPALCSIILSSPVVFIRYRKPSYRPALVAFNLSHIGIEMSLAVLAWHTFGGELGTYKNILALTVYLVVYCAANVGIMTIEIKLQFESGWRETLIGVFDLQAVILYIVDISLGVFMGLAFQIYHIWAVPTIAGILWMISVSYKQYFHTVNDARRDELTGLLNRKEFKRQLHMFMKRGKPFSVMMLDLDRFKQVNDTLGHLQGDQVLRAVGTLIFAEMGGDGIVARYGGEEFCVIVPDVRKGSWDIADHIRSRVEEHKFDELPDRQQGGVTVSIGLASFPDDGTTADALMEHADQALYAAKTVRNSVVEYDDSIQANRHDAPDDENEPSIVPTVSQVASSSGFHGNRK